jgi:hypothetical protein
MYVERPNSRGFVWSFTKSKKPPAGIAAQAIEEAQRQRAERHDDEDDDEADEEVEEVSPWCQEGILPERAALLQQALEAAGTFLPELTRAGTVVQVGSRPGYGNAGLVSATKSSWPRISKSWTLR